MGIRTLVKVEMMGVVSSVLIGDMALYSVSWVRDWWVSLIFFVEDFSSIVSPLQLWLLTPTGVAHLRANSLVHVE